MAADITMRGEDSGVKTNLGSGSGFSAVQEHVEKSARIHQGFTNV